MNVDHINEALFRGELDRPGVLPHVRALGDAPFVFRQSFGLDSLPEEPGVILVRGARQYGKSTWLERQIAETIEQYGPGTAFYLNGDVLRDADTLSEAIRALVPLFAAEAPVRRLFIDEITAVDGWERGLKRVIDAGEVRRVLVVTTGSKATDLRRGSERLPGRKGRLDRTSYLFTPVMYAEFRRLCGEQLGAQTLPAYMLAGGCPVALSEIARHGRLPEYVLEMVRDWIHGEVAASGRQRSSLLAVMECLMQRGGTPVGQARLAREAGLANNTVAAGYIELLADLTCVGIAQAWDASRRVRLTRRPAKFPFINLLAAAAWHPARPRSADAFALLEPEEQGRWCEWLVAQELWRRAAVRGDDSPEQLLFWGSKQHELDFVCPPATFVEVKRGRTGPLELGWFPKVFPDGRLLVVGGDRFETDRIRGLTLEDFLLDDSVG
ncbi:MAG: hypothetical protein AMXMBFR64_01530 [Myxococcales bacterium]